MWDNALHGRHQLVSLFCKTQGTKRHQKGLFPDFQLRVHMHCPGQVSIQREMKRKKINSFYMNAQQAVLVCVCLKEKGQRGKMHICKYTQTPKHILWGYSIYAPTHMTNMDTHVWVSRPKKKTKKHIANVIVRAKTCNLLRHLLIPQGWESWPELAALCCRDLRALLIKTRDFISLENQDWQWLRFTIKMHLSFCLTHISNPITIFPLPSFASIFLSLHSLSRLRDMQRSHGPVTD